MDTKIRNKSYRDVKAIQNEESAEHFDYNLKWDKDKYESLTKDELLVEIKKIIDRCNYFEELNYERVGDYADLALRLERIKGRMRYAIEDDDETN